MLPTNYATAEYAGNGVLTSFAVPFPYRDPVDIEVLVNETPVSFTVSSPGTVTLASAPGLGYSVLVRRNTSQATRLVDFETSAALTESVLDAAHEQTFNMAQEAIDMSSRSAAMVGGLSSAVADAEAAAAIATSKAGEASGHSAQAAVERSLAQSAQGAAALYRNEAESFTVACDTIYYAFDKTYLGYKSSNPTVDNRGASLINGALYWNPTAGETRVWNGFAWVPLTTAAPATPGKNYVINGALNVWQRGTVFTNCTIAGTTQYTADRWIGNRDGEAAGMSVDRYAITSGERSASGLPLPQYAMRWSRAAGDSGLTALNLFYAVETADSLPLAGQTCVLSLAVRAGANYSGGVFSVIFSSGTGANQREYAFTARAAVSSGPTLTGTFVKHSLTYAVPAGATQVGARFSWTPTGTAGADDSVYLTDVKIELGSVPSGFQGDSYAADLVKCQRYYQVVEDTTVHGTRQAAVNVALQLLTFPQTMRTTPVWKNAPSSWVAAGSPPAGSANAYDFAAGAYVSLTGALSTAQTTLSPTGIRPVFTAGTSFSGAAGAPVGTVFGSPFRLDAEL